MRCDRGMYACIAGSCGSASLGFTLIYQAGLAGQRFSAFTRFPRFSHAPFPFSFRIQVGEMTRRLYSSGPPFSARRISYWVKWRTSSIALMPASDFDFCLFYLFQEKKEDTLETCRLLWQNPAHYQCLAPFCLCAGRQQERTLVASVHGEH